jgi:hypothetical protein
METAATDAILMIERLQWEKATAKMEARQIKSYANSPRAMKTGSGDPGAARIAFRPHRLLPLLPPVPWHRPVVLHRRGRWRMVWGRGRRRRGADPHGRVGNFCELISVTTQTSLWFICVLVSVCELISICLKYNTFSLPVLKTWKCDQTTENSFSSMLKNLNKQLFCAQNLNNLFQFNSAANSMRRWSRSTWPRWKFLWAYFS